MADAAPRPRHPLVTFAIQSAPRVGSRRYLTIVAVMDTKIVSGPGRQLTALAEKLRERGHDAHIILFQRAGRPTTPFAQYLVDRRIPHTLIGERFLGDPAAIRGLSRKMNELEPDVVQTHGYKASCFVALLRKLGGRWPWIGCWHGATTEDWKVRVYHRLDRMSLRAADHVLVMSAPQRELFNGYPNVSQVNNAVLDLPATAPRKPRSDDDHVPTLGVLGRLSSEKGVDVFLHACATLLARGTRFSAVIGGDGPERDRLVDLAERLGLAGNVRFLGTVTDISKFYASIDALVIPSRSEGLPNVLLEAIAAGLPIVATRVGEIPIVLKEPGVGMTVEPDDAPALGDAIQFVLTEFKPAPAARVNVLDHYSLDRRVSEHLRLYSHLAGRT
jgi:glycosyltransferase involved in cell wall biosynthesis